MALKKQIYALIFACTFVPTITLSMNFFIKTTFTQTDVTHKTPKQISEIILHNKNNKRLLINFVKLNKKASQKLLKEFTDRMRNDSDTAFMGHFICRKDDKKTDEEIYEKKTFDEKNSPELYKEVSEDYIKTMLTFKSAKVLSIMLIEENKEFVRIPEKEENKEFVRIPEKEEIEEIDLTEKN
jgi:hypothetical protein